MAKPAPKEQAEKVEKKSEPQKAKAKGAKYDEASAVRSDLLKAMENSLVSDLDMSDKVIVLDAKTDPKKAIEILIENKVRAAPVIDGDKFIGVLDLRDTVKFALETYKKKSSNMDDLKQKAMEYLTSSPQITTQSLKYLSRMRHFGTVKESDNLMAVARVLANGAHIVGVVSAKEKALTGIITQGAFFQQIAKRWKFDTDCALHRLLDLKYITSPIKSIRNNVKAYDAFELMSKLDLSGLAVVNADGVLIHNTSATDIKLWLIASSTLEDSIEQFLINIRKLSLSEKYPITVCTLNDSLKRAVQKLQATRYHRLWIVDSNTCPIGVLALTDIFKFIVKAKESSEKAQANDDDDQKQN